MINSKNLQPDLNSQEVKELGDKFVEVLGELGIKEIKDIPNINSCQYSKDNNHKGIWIIK